MPRSWLKWAALGSLADLKRTGTHFHVSASALTLIVFQLSTIFLVLMLVIKLSNAYAVTIPCMDMLQN